VSCIAPTILSYNVISWRVCSKPWQHLLQIWQSTFLFAIVCSASCDRFMWQKCTESMLDCWTDWENWSGIQIRQHPVWMLDIEQQDCCLLWSAALVTICHGATMMVFLLSRRCCSAGGQAGTGLQHLHDPQWAYFYGWSQLTECQSPVWSNSQSHNTMKKGMQETIPTNVPNTVAVSADVAACDCAAGLVYVIQLVALQWLPRWNQEDCVCDGVVSHKPR